MRRQLIGEQHVLVFPILIQVGGEPSNDHSGFANVGNELLSVDYGYSNSGSEF